MDFVNINLRNREGNDKTSGWWGCIECLVDEACIGNQWMEGVAEVT